MGRVGPVGILAAALIAAVTPIAGQATFDVASVKPNRSGFPGGSTEFLPGQFIARNQTLRILILAAYNLEDFRVVGGPDWVASRSARGSAPRIRRPLSIAGRSRRACRPVNCRRAACGR